MTSRDAETVAGFLGELGYPNTAQFVQRKYNTLQREKSDAVLVAEIQGEVVGLVHLHHCELFHESGRVGRVMALVVKNGYRRKGVGRELMLAVENEARKSGCVQMEVTSAIRRQNAHRFYAKLGYVEEPKRFVKLFS